MSLPQIKALNPTVIPPIEAKTFDEWRMMDLHVDANDIRKPVDCIVRLQKGRQLGGGEWEMSPDNEVKFLRYENLIDSATRDPGGLGQVVFGLLNYVSVAMAAQERAAAEAEQRRRDEEAARIAAEQASNGTP